MFSDEALSLILSEADRIVCDAQALLDKAVESGREELVEAARNNLRMVIENRDRLSHVFALRPATADAEA
ncbi:MAG TPA: hypothetical protein VNN73_04355 [Blastocatellia bacterium]|nr:hypothetical protein [Blastocatellia bacterium]